MRKFRKTTIRDVAERAGVSIAAVSLYLRGKRDVCSPETARRIDEAVDTLNYAAAPALRWQKRGTQTIGLCVGLPYGAAGTPDIHLDSFAEQIWRGALQVADRQSYSLLHFPKDVRDGRSPTPFLDGRIDGLLLYPGWEDPRPARLAAAGLPTVLVARSRNVPGGCGAVFTTEGDTVELALSHLWNLGHRRIAHIAGPIEPPTAEAAAAAVAAGHILYDPNDMALARVERYTSWMRVHGAYDPALLFHAAGWGFSRASAAALVAGWQEMTSPPTAVFCANDSLALTLMRAARAAGLAIPNELSIVGVDDSPTASRSDPPLTSIRLPGEELGREAMRCLLQALGTENPPDKTGVSGSAMSTAAAGKAFATAVLEATAAVKATATAEADTPCSVGIPVTRLAARGSTGPRRL